MKIIKFFNFINEDLSGEITTKLSDTNKDIKEDIVTYIQKTINSNDTKVFIEKLDSIIREPEESTIDGLTQDADIYEFYLKYRNDLDEILNQEGFFEDLQDFQKNNNCISLYDFVVKGTKSAIIELLNSIKKDLSGEVSPE
jgi:hypothetical protein